MAQRVVTVLGLGGRTIDRDVFTLGPFDVLGAVEAAVGEMACRKMAEALAQPLQHRAHETAIGAGVGDLDRRHDLLAGRACHLHVVGRAEAAVGHLHHPRIGVRGGGARLLLGFAVVVLFGALLALLLDLGERALRRFEPLGAFARRPLLGRPDALVTGIRLGVHLALERLDHLLGRRQMPIQRRRAAKRRRAGAGAHPHPVLRQGVEIDQARLGQRRHMLSQQPIKQIGAIDPEVRQRVIVHRHPAAQPAIHVVARAQPLQRPRAANALAGGVKPQRQQKPRRNRGMARSVLARPDPVFEQAQIEALDIAPDHPHRVVLSDQAVDIDCPQFNLIALGRAQPRVGTLAKLRVR